MQRDRCCLCLCACSHVRLMVRCGVCGAVRCVCGAVRCVARWSEAGHIVRRGGCGAAVAGRRACVQLMAVVSGVGCGVGPRYATLCPAGR
eukprot:415433-Prymnesium_polylepis.1